MADHVDQVNMNDLMLTANTFSIKTIKEEQCEGDSFIEDEVRISETGDITMDNPELQNHDVWQDKLMQYDAYKTSDNIRTELASFEVTDIQNDNIKVEEEITPETEFVKVEEEIAAKIEFDNGRLYCEHCKAYYQDYCTNCGMLVHILNKYARKNSDSAALDDIPNDILELRDCFEHTGVYALRIIPAAVKFGPFTGLSGTECPWEMKGDKFVLDKNKWQYLNWMQNINPARNISEGNLQVFQCEDNIYYESTRPIHAYEELLVYFGVEDGNSPNKIGRLNFVTVTKDIINDVFACTFCCLGFSSISHLAKHKTICVQDTAGKFSIEELTQCLFCKVQLELKECSEHHMAFCFERNARKGILPTPPAKQERRFKTKEFPRLHVKTTHAFIGGKDNQEHSTSRNTHTRVEQSSLQYQKNRFKCSLCVFRTKYKHVLRLHTKTKHMKEFEYKCDSCEFVTNRKIHLKIHIKTKHLKKFDYKCGLCEFGTNMKRYLEIHIKTRHLKQFNFKCNCCEFGTNSKSHLECHIKTKHLKIFDYKCDSCEYETNNKRNFECHVNTKHLKNCKYCEFETNSKSNLEYHVKSKHLKELDYRCDSCEYRTIYKRNFICHMKAKHLLKFDYKCDSCEFGTNNKGYLEKHIKSKHLKQFDYTCDCCEFRTNKKCDLERHIKHVHFKIFDYKCDCCEYGTDLKNNLERHIKNKHLMKYDFKCDSCQFGTTNKRYLERHIKNMHLKQFDYKCDCCEFRTNDKRNLKVHMKAIHLKQYNYKCDFCERRTNNKRHLEVHIKAVHLKQFDYKCESCEFGTNSKSYLKSHIKTNHLKEFDYKCDSCEFATNFKFHLKRHIKNNHLKNS